jgi:hemoglobin
MDQEVLHDIISTEDIRKLIDTFYTRVKEDEVIGYIFNEVANVNWEHHLPKMYAFWEFLLLGGESYSGNPIEPHKNLHQRHPLKKEFFDRWVELFTRTVDENFRGINAEEAKNKARLIAMTWIPKFTSGIQ